MRKKKTAKNVLYVVLQVLVRNSEILPFTRGTIAHFLFFFPPNSLQFYVGLDPCSMELIFVLLFQLVITDGKIFFSNQFFFLFGLKWWAQPQVQLEPVSAEMQINNVTRIPSLKRDAQWREITAGRKDAQRPITVRAQRIRSPRGWCMYTPACCTGA